MNEIDYSKLRSVKARKLIRALQRDGFVFDHQTGSHRVYYHPDGRRVVVVFHRPGDTFPPKTLRGIIQDTGWTEADLRRLGLMK